MPDRIVRDELLESDRWLNVPRNTHRLAFVCLLLQADALGNMEGSDGRLWRLWRDTLKLDARTAIAEILEALLSQDLIRLYEADGKRLIHIPRYRQRLRYLGNVSPPSPWTTEEQKQRLEKKSPGASQELTGRAPAEVKRREVEVKRNEEKNLGVTPHSSARGNGQTIKTVLENLTVKGEKPNGLSRDEQLAFVAKNGGKP